MQLIAEMERLVEDEKLRVTSVETWKNMAPKILSQAKIEATHNSRLRLALEEKPHGIVNTTMYTCPTLLTQEGERQYALHIHTDTCTCGYFLPSFCIYRQCPVCT